MLKISTLADYMYVTIVLQVKQVKFFFFFKVCFSLLFLYFKTIFLIVIIVFVKRRC